MQQIGQKEQYDRFVSDKIHFEKDGESIMIIISVTGILLFLLALAIIAVLIWLVIQVFCVLVAGAGALGLSVTDTIKAKKFYAECKKRELGKPEEVSREKLNLVAELVGLKEEPRKIYDIYLNFYRNDHRDEYPEYFAEKDKECSERKEKSKKTAIKVVAYIVISVLAGMLTSYIANYTGQYASTLIEIKGQSEVAKSFWIFASIFSPLYLIMLGIVSAKIEEWKGRKQKKEEEKKKLEEQINITK